MDPSTNKGRISIEARSLTANVDAYCWQPLNFDGLVQSRELGLHLPDVNSNMSGLLASWNTAHRPRQAAP